MPVPVNQTPLTFTSRFTAFRDQHRVHVSGALAVIATLTLMASEIFPKVHDIVQKNQVIEYVILFVVLDLAVSIHLLKGHGAAHLARNQDESLTHLIEAVHHCRTGGVDLLEYAGSTTLPLIRAIQREGVPMRMLVKHPDTVAGLQRQRMITTLDTLFNSIFENHQSYFEVRCYRMPFCVRGRRLGQEVLELGWLTPDTKRQTAYGHSNPSVVVDLSTKSSDFVREFFERTFEDLWKADDTEDARVVLQRIQSAAKI